MMLFEILLIICDWTSNLWPPICASDLWIWCLRHRNWGRKWFVYFITGKTELASIDQEIWCYWCKNGRACPQWKIIVKLLVLSFFSNFDWVLALFLLLNFSIRKLESLRRVAQHDNALLSELDNSQFKSHWCF